MDNTQEHANSLRRAMAQADLTQRDLATALGVSIRTIVNWTSRTEPTMPSGSHQARLARLLPGYSDGGDPVEAAIKGAELAPYRRTELIAAYQRLLHEERMEQARRGA